jgi:L-asparaginase II
MRTTRFQVVARRESSSGPIAENVHRVQLAIARPDGTLLGSTGDDHRPTLARSSAKPFQLLALFAADAADGVDDAELALAAASHKGAAWQTEPIRRWLERLGLQEDALQCGAHPPSDPSEAARLRDAGLEPGNLHHNCSGKHCAMLAVARKLGADPRHYLRAGLPTQTLVRRAVETVAGRGRPVRVAWAVDGCSAPTPALPLGRLAGAWASLAAAGAGEAIFDPDVAEPDGLSLDVLSAGLTRIFAVMREHAELVAGPGILDTAAMRAIQHIVCKRGADGVYGMAIARSAWGPLGVALKIEDGSSEARDPAVMAVLEALGLLNPASRVALAPYIRPRRINARGLVVGHLEPELEPAWTP